MNLCVDFLILVCLTTGEKGKFLVGGVLGGEGLKQSLQSVWGVQRQNDICIIVNHTGS